MYWLLAAAFACVSVAEGNVRPEDFVKTIHGTPVSATEPATVWHVMDIPNQLLLAGFFQTFIDGEADEHRTLLLFSCIDP